MLTTQYVPAKQAGNGVTVAFNFSFKILAATDLQVFKIDANGNQGSVLILNTDYTVVFDPIAETGTVTYTIAPLMGGFSLIKRVSDNTQQTSLPREGVTPAKTIETMVDKLDALIQETQVNVAAFSIATSTVQLDTFANLQAKAALNPTTPFMAVVTDQRLIRVYLGNLLLGQVGWATIGGY